MPVAMPTCRNVELMPEAMPERRGSTTPMAAVASAGLVRPMPPPATRKPASSAVQSSPGSTPRISSSPMPDERQPAGQEPAHAEALGELAGDRRDDEREQRDRQEAQAGLERASSRGCSARRASGTGTSRTSTPTARRRRSTRRRTPACGTARGRASAARTRRSTSTKTTSSTAAPARQARIGGAPVLGVAADEPEDGAGTARPENVTVPAQSSARAVRVARLLHARERERDRGDADRQVDEEDRLPADGLDEHAADQRPDRHGGAGRRAPEAERGAAVAALVGATRAAPARWRTSSRRRRPAGRARG